MRTVFRNNEIEGRIHALQSFLSVGKLPDGTRRMWGTAGPAPDMGFLPRKFHESARQAVYTVVSYGTPIAWVVENIGGPIDQPYLYLIPNVGYSPSTGQHQSTVLSAWADFRLRQGARRWKLDGTRTVVRVPGNAVVYGRERRLRSGGMDGHMPGAGLDGGAPVDPHEYAYPGTGQNQRMGPPVGEARGRSHP